jgi:hypothetical protein
MDEAEQARIKAAIEANAALVLAAISRETGQPARYDEAAVAWVDDFIEGMQEQPDSKKEKFIDTLGSFLGECVRQTYGGQWRWNAGMETWGVHFSEEGDKNAVFPFNKTRKHLLNGPGSGDSVLSFFRMIPVVFKKE